MAHRTVPTRSSFGALAIVALGALVLVGACGTQAESRGTPPTGPGVTPTTGADRTPSTAPEVAQWPDRATHGPDALFLELGRGPGIDGVVTPRGFTIYADGTVVDAVPQPTDPNSRLDPEFVVSKLNARGMQILRERLVGAGLIGDNLPDDRVMPDRGSLSVTVRDRGRRYYSEIADSEKHADASALLSQLSRLATVVGEENIVTGPPMRARFIAFGTYRIPAGGVGVGDTVTPWPAGSVSPAPARCGSFDGPDADFVRRTLASAPGRAIWSTENGELYGVEMRALLPDEIAACGR